MDEKNARVNELLKETEGLTSAEKWNKPNWEYIEGYRRSCSLTLKQIKIVDEEGNDVTPKTTPYNEKGLHRPV